MTSSYEKLNYLIRPAKQVERKLLIEGMHRLGAGGFVIRDYRYIGLGSPFYADFVLFHRYLYINDMVCVEHSQIPRRMRFNKPFRGIRLHMGPVSEVIPLIDRSKRHLVWLDYDYEITEGVLGDLSGFASTLPSESIVVVTVEADPLVPDRGDVPGPIVDQIREYRRQILQEQVGRYVTGGVKIADVCKARLPVLYAAVLVNRLRDELATRALKFIQLFNFAYADGRQMLSLGGMIADEGTARKLRRSGVFELPFVKGTRQPVVISVPPLTVRERLWLDQNQKEPRRLFEGKKRAVGHYLRYYRYYPSYVETLF